MNDDYLRNVGLWEAFILCSVYLWYWKFFKFENQRLKKPMSKKSDSGWGQGVGEGPGCNKINHMLATVRLWEEAMGTSGML